MPRRKSLLVGPGGSTACKKVEVNHRDDDGSVTNSISRGVFCFKRGKFKLNSASLGGAQARVQLDVENMMPRAYEELKLYISQTCQAIQSATFNDVLTAVSYFCSQPSVDGRIPCCALLTAINMADRSLLFSLLESRILDNGAVAGGEMQGSAPIIASINSQSVTQTVKSVVSALARQLMVALVDRVMSEDKDKVKDKSNRRATEFPSKEQTIDRQLSPAEIIAGIRKDNLTLAVVAGWYAKLFPDTDKTNQTKPPPPLVIIVEDFEQFQPSVMQDFVLNLIGYTSQLPLVLVLGISTSVANVHKTLAKRSIRERIQVTSYSAVKTMALADAYVAHLCVGIHAPPTFRLTSHPLQIVMDNFASHTFSLAHLDFMFQLCLFEHFASSAVVRALCVPPPCRQGPEAKRLHFRALANSVDDKLLDEIRSLKSVRRFVEREQFNSSSRELVKLVLTSDDQLRRQLEVWLMDLDCVVNLFSLPVQIVHLLEREGSTRHAEIHLTYQRLMADDDNCDGGYLSTSAYRDLFQSISNVSCLDLADITAEILSICARYHQVDARLDELVDRLRHQVSSQSYETEPRTPTKSRPADSDKTSRLTSRAQLREELAANVGNCNITNSGHKTGDPSGGRRQICSAIHDIIDYVVRQRKPTQLPLAEIYFFDNTSKLQFTSVGASVHTSLAYPACHLATSPLLRDDLIRSSDGGGCPEFDKVLPGVALAYQLASECGKFVNLHDWFEAWCCPPEPGLAADPVKISDAKLDALIAAKLAGSSVESGLLDRLSSFATFAKCVSSLQYVGLVQPSRRKLDHMVRSRFAIK